jgi:hypothetical protein
MANDLTMNPWKLDTTGALSSENVRIERARWVGGTTAGHTCEVRDGAGKTIVAFVATGANYSEDVPVWREVTGVTLQTLGSGTLYLSIATRPKRF